VAGPGVKTTNLPTPYAHADTRGAFGEAYAGAIDRVSIAVDSVEQGMDREAREMKAKADAISQANADTAYQRAETARMVGGSNRRTLVEQAFDGGPSETLTPADVKDEPGFLSTKGKDAYAQSGKVLKDLEQQRQQIAKDHFSNPEARERWLTRSNGMLADSERRVETHAAQQFEVARKDALEGARASALDSIGNAKSPQDVAAIAQRTEERIRELALSKEGGDADVAKFREDALATRIGSLLIDDDVQQAEGQFNAAKDVLSVPVRSRVQSAIVAAKKANGVRKFDVEAQGIVDVLIDAGTSPVGKLDLEVVDSKASLIPPGPMKDEMESRLGPAKEKALRRWKQRVDQFAGQAGSTYEKTGSLGAVDPRVKSWLIENAYEEWQKLRHDAERDVDRAKAHRTGDRAAIAEQTAVDRLALSEFRELTSAARASADVDAFLRGRGVSPIGGSAVKGEKTRSLELVRNGDAMSESEFVRSVEAATAGIVGKNKDKAREVKAQAVEAYGNLRAKNKAKPSSEEVQAEVDHLTATAATAPRFLESIRGKGNESEIERQAREKKEAAKKAAPPNAAAAPPSAPADAKNQAAINWARANPGDPRSAAILKKLGVK